MKFDKIEDFCFQNHKGQKKPTCFDISFIFKEEINIRKIKKNMSYVRIDIPVIIKIVFLQVLAISHNVKIVYTTTIIALPRRN